MSKFDIKHAWSLVDLVVGLVDLSPRRLRRLGGQHGLAGSWYDRASPPARWGVVTTTSPLALAAAGDAAETRAPAGGVAPRRL